MCAMRSVVVVIYYLKRYFLRSKGQCHVHLFFVNTILMTGYIVFKHCMFAYQKMGSISSLIPIVHTFDVTNAAII